MQRYSTAFTSLLLFVIVSIIFFVTGGFSRTPTEWVCYCFIAVSFFCLGAMSLTAVNGESGHVLNASATMISGAYLVIELIVGSFFIIGLPDSLISAFIVQLVILAIYVLIMASVLTTNRRTSQADIEGQAMRANFRNTVSYAQQIALYAQDPVVKQAIQEVIEVLRFSPVKSSPAAFQLDEGISQQLAILDSAVANGDSNTAIAATQQIKYLVAMRNEAIKSAL